MALLSSLCPSHLPSHFFLPLFFFLFFLLKELSDTVAYILTLSSPSQQRPSWPLAMKFSAHGSAVKSSNFPVCILEFCNVFPL